MNERPNIFDISCHKGKHAFFCTINIERDERMRAEWINSHEKKDLFHFQSGSISYNCISEGKYSCMLKKEQE